MPIWCQSALTKTSKPMHLQGFWPKSVYLKCFGNQLKTVYLQGPHSSRPLWWQLRLPWSSPPSALENSGKNCWDGCNKQQGRCNWCGTDGYCCRKGWSIGNGCDGTFGGTGHHLCLLKSSAGNYIFTLLLHINNCNIELIYLRWLHGNDSLISWMLAPLGCFLCVKNDNTKERLL